MHYRLLKYFRIKKFNNLICKRECLQLLGWLGSVQPSVIPWHSHDNLTSIQIPANVDEPILMGRLNRRPTFEPKMVMKETESCLLQNLKSQLWAIGCIEIFSSIWVAY
jgi:hypothetical protein